MKELNLQQGAKYVDQNTSNVASKNSVALTDNREESRLQRKLIENLQNRGIGSSVIQQKANLTGLPDQLKSGIENLSGYAMDDVKVYFNSSQPAQLNAHAYAQGTQIHIGPGQEKHLAHEAWHVVQQKQGRVKPTLQMKGKVGVNDDEGLEKEADAMGAKAMNERFTTKTTLQYQEIGTKIHQRVVIAEEKEIPSATALLKILLEKENEKVMQIIEGIPKPIVEKILKEFIGDAATFNLAEDRFLQEFSEKAEAARLRVRETSSRVDAGHSVRGRVKELPYTHNTNLNGALGILGTGVFTSNAEPNVNFRRDIDSRYAGGVTLVMKQGFDVRDDTILHDLYHKSEIFLEEKSLHVPLAMATEDEHAAWARLMELTKEQSDFRGNKTLKRLPPLKSIKDKKEEAKLLASQLINIRKGIPELQSSLSKGKELLSTLNTEFSKIRSKIQALEQREVPQGGRLPPIGRSNTAASRLGAPILIRTETESAKLKRDFDSLRTRIRGIEQKIQATEADLASRERDITQHDLIIAKLKEDARRLLIQRQEALAHNSSLSLTNPQVRIPIGQLGADSIDHMLIHHSLYDQVVSVDARGRKAINPEYEALLAEGMRTIPTKSKVSTAIKASGGAGRTANKAMRQLTTLVNEGRVHRVHTVGSPLSHAAGRLADKSRGREAEKELKRSAAMGMEIHPDFFDEKTNNSPGAYSPEAFHEFQKAYYQILISQGLLY